MTKPLDWYVNKEYIAKDGMVVIKVTKTITYGGEIHILWVKQTEYHRNGEYHKSSNNQNEGNMAPVTLEEEYVLLTKASRLLYGK